MSTVAPRMVQVTRATEYQRLIERHGTHGQAAFFLSGRGRSIDDVLAVHEAVESAIGAVHDARPAHWRSAAVTRDELARFVFEPADVVVVVGPDGLVANVAKYLDGQPVVGVNPLPDRYEGVLVTHAAVRLQPLLEASQSPDPALESRTMAEARLDDGQVLRCLNEVFVGHASHQSARYVLRHRDGWERQSSSGLIASTGTGATGWARSIHLTRRSTLELPALDAPELAFLVREPWPSVHSGADLVEGLVAGDAPLAVECEMEEGGVVFGDGIESDRLELHYGQRLEIRPADTRLTLLR